jgi:hypothetical protein
MARLTPVRSLLGLAGASRQANAIATQNLSHRGPCWSRTGRGRSGPLNPGRKGGRRRCDCGAECFHSAAGTGRRIRRCDRLTEVRCGGGTASQGCESVPPPQKQVERQRQTLGTPTACQGHSVLALERWRQRQTSCCNAVIRQGRRSALPACAKPSRSVAHSSAGARALPSALADTGSASGGRATTGTGTSPRRSAMRRHS